MTSDASRNPLEPIRMEIEHFLSAYPNVSLFEDGAELMDLSAAEWRLSVAYGKLLFEAWSGERSIVRRVEEIAYQDSGKLGLFIRKDLGRAAGVLELHESGAATAFHGDTRATLRREIVAYLARQFPGWKVERVSNRSDRERSFSAWYTRGLVRRGQAAWAFAAMDSAESPAAADAALAYGLNWLDWLRENARDYVVSGLKLFLPEAAIPVTALRAAHLDAGGLEIFAWPQDGPPEPVHLGEFANTETHLVPRRDAGAWIDRNRDLLVHWFGAALGRLDAVADPAGNALSFRVFGLELARMEGQLAPRLLWGLEGNRRTYREEEREEFRGFVERVLRERAAPGCPGGEIYRLQPERWLESLLLRDISKIDPGLVAGQAYPQVPAFSGSFRGVVDILGISREGRLAVIELKLDEDVTLPLQGLDYWIRVNWLNERGQFHPAGYFPGRDISPLPPVLYLVSPAFRFHPSNERIIRYFRQSIEVIAVGLNQQWREGVKVLFRKRRTGEL